MGPGSFCASTAESFARRQWQGRRAGNEPFVASGWIFGKGLDKGRLWCSLLRTPLRSVVRALYPGSNTLLAYRLDNVVSVAVRRRHRGNSERRKDTIFLI